MELNPENPLIPVRNPERFLQNMHSIIALTSRVGPVPPRAVLLYEDLLLQLHESREKALKLTPCQMPYLERLIDEIRLNPQNDWDFEKEAEECHITPTHFRRLFKEAAGLPPLQFLLQNRLQKAAGLLIHTSDPVSIIAEESGIDNPFYFSRLFKEKYQISPLEYRRIRGNRLIPAFIFISADKHNAIQGFFRQAAPGLPKRVPPYSRSPDSPTSKNRRFCHPE